MKLLNPASRDLIRQSLSSQKPLFFDASVRTPDTSSEKSGEKWQLTEYVALALNPLLNDRPQAEAQTLAEEALKVILARQLTGPQVSQLVKWVSAGHPANGFNHQIAAAKKPKVTKPPVHHSPSAQPASAVTAETDTHAAVAQATLAPASQPARIPKATQTITDSPIAGAKAPLESAQPNLGSRPEVSTQAKAMGSTETALYEAVAGMSVIAKIKTKIKKGERPNFFEVLLLAGHQLWSILAWLGKHAYKLAKPVSKFVWKIVKDSLKGLLKALGRTVYNVVRVVIGLAVLALLAWFGWEVYKNGFHPRRALMDIGKTLAEWTIMLWRQG
jgi:hypothetical protein